MPSRPFLRLPTPTGGSRFRPRFGHRDVILLVIALFFAVGLVRAQPTEPADGAGMLVLGGAPAAMLDTRVDASIAGMVATVSVRQRFRNDDDGWLEGHYRFPLPPDAAVNDLVMVVGDRRIEGEIQEKQAAEATFAAAREAGRTASLVGQSDGNLFRTAVTNVPPGETVEVALTYVQEVPYGDAQFRFRFPTTVTPRFGDARAGAEPAPPTLAPPRVTITVDLAAGFELAHVATPHHDARISAGDPRQRRVEVEAAADRDFELIWEPRLGAEPRAALLTERGDDAHYGLLMLLPPEPDFASATPRELVLVIDRSGSMGGAPMRQARESLLMAVGSLGAGDRFNVIAFDDAVDAVFPEPVDATAGNVGEALAWIDALRADGGTNMAPALAFATSGAAPPGMVRQIVFVTDGAVAGERRLFAQIARDLGTARLFTVGIGAAPNAWFMRKAAEFGRGSYTFIGSEDQVAERMDRLLRRLEHPVMTDLCVDWPGAGEHYPAELPDLYLGEPLVVAVRLDDPSSAKTVGACGKRAGAWWEETVAARDAHGGEAVAALWARRKVAGLMDDLTLGADPAMVRDAVLDVALAHRLVTEYTSFVAVDRTPERTRDAALARGRFGNAVPQGASAAAALAMPATDAGTVMRVTLGLMMLLLGWILVRRLRDVQ
ncbi:MAG: VIT domain-containing protein [Pseudomonadota bacterium]